MGECREDPCLVEQVCPHRPNSQVSFLASWSNRVIVQTSSTISIGVNECSFECPQTSFDLF